MTPRQEWEFRSENCRICGRRDFKVLGARGGVAHRNGLGVECRIVQCRECHTVFPDPMPYPKGPDVRYSDLEGYFNEVMKVGHDQQMAVGKGLAATAAEMLGGPGRFLDVGCGRGEIVRAAAEMGWSAVGCDISAEYVEYARRENGIDARLGSLEKLDLEPDSFDFVSLVEVIEHLYEPLKAMDALRRIIRKDGVLYMSTPNEESIYQSLGNLYYKAQGKDWVVNLCPTWNLFHILGFSPRSLRYLLENNGFKVERIVVYPGTLVVPRRNSLLGKLEGVGIDIVEKLANFMGRSPYMYAWARRVD